MSVIQRFADSAALAHGAAQLFVQRAQQAITARGQFTTALSGGSTPKQLFTLLAHEPYRSQIDWSQVYFFWGDERCVPPDTPDSNYGMARAALLAHIPVPAENIYRMKGELEPAAAADEYNALVREFFQAQQPRFDLVLLGIGDDGHTASLFPGTAALQETERVALANYVDKLNAWRLTLTQTAINAAELIVFLAAGESKATILQEVIHGPYQPEVYPAQLIEPVNGELIWMVDEAAARLL